MKNVKSFANFQLNKAGNFGLFKLKINGLEQVEGQKARDKLKNPITIHFGRKDITLHSTKERSLEFLTTSRSRPNK